MRLPNRILLSFLTSKSIEISGVELITVLKV
jgi:hypothetical protein